MSTYVMTDIHGCYDAMKRMLGKIGFSDRDRLICAGDYIDRGPQSYEMLCWLESPGENVTLIRGNHDEEFIYYVALMKQVAEQKKLAPDSLEDTRTAYGLSAQALGYFDYYKTIQQLIREKQTCLRQLFRWAAHIQKMPYYYELTMNSRRCIVVHAGYLESLECLKDVESDGIYSSLEDFWLTARDDAYLYGGVEHGMILAGHTPTVARYELPYNNGDVYRFYDEEQDCVFYDLDCGCVFGRSGLGTGGPEAKLVCLRLEDETIFYVC